MNPDVTMPESPPTEAIQVPIIYVKEGPVWEYRLLVRSLRDEKPPDEETLNVLGAEGWELAGILTDLPFVYLYFKRLAG